VPFQYFVLAPALSNANDFAFLGETNKFITVSRQRFKDIQNYGQKVSVIGIPEEKVELSWKCNAPEIELKLSGKKLDANDKSSLVSRKGDILKLVTTIPTSGSMEIEVYVH
jgi:hypothetical protein